MTPASDNPQSPVVPSEVELLREVDRYCDEFEAAWMAGGAPECEAYVVDATGDILTAALAELILIEWQYRGGGDDPTAVRTVLSEREALRHACEMAGVRIDAVLAGAVQESARQRSAIEKTTAYTPRSALGGSAGLHLRCPHCQNGVELLADAPLDQITCQSCGSQFGLVGEDANSPTHCNATPRRIGRFVLEERLGVGGFGAVWKARDPELDRYVALKIPRSNQLLPHEMELFLREARAAAQLNHSHIVPVHEVGRDGKNEGSIFIVSELIHGEPLSDRLKRERLPNTEVAGLLATVSEALHYAHEQGVIHRDLKPSNVMVDDQGEPHVMDFGLAKRETGEITMTIDGQVLGTPAYMSPEQAGGQMKWVDRRTDVYSLGVMLFQMLTGELPFRGSAQSQIQQRQTDDAPSPRRIEPLVPLDLATVCLKCLERDPNRRYATAGDFAEELRRWQRGEPVAARPLSSVGRVVRWARRRPALATALALGTVLAIAGPVAAVVIYGQRTEIGDRLAETSELLRRSEQEIDHLEQEKDVLRNGVRSQQSPRVGDSLPEWRRRLISEFLASRGSELEIAFAATEAKGLAAAEARLGLGYLYAAVDRRDEAIQELTAAESLFQELPEDPQSKQRHAECCDQLSRLLSEAGRIEKGLPYSEQALATRRDLVAGDSPPAKALVDLLAILIERRHTGDANSRPTGSLVALPQEMNLTLRTAQALSVDPNDIYEQTQLLLRATP